MATSMTTPTTSGSDDFATPVYLDGSGETGTGASANSSDLSNMPVLNLDDPNLLMEEQDVNQDQDAYAAPPPLPDARWLARIKARDVKGNDGNPAKYKVGMSKDGKPYAFAALEAEIIDPSGKYDRVKVFDYYVSTRPDPYRNNAVPMAWILGRLGVKLPAKINAKVLVDEFHKALAAEPQIEIDTVWEGSPDQDGQDRLDQAGEKFRAVLGQHRFPQDSKGNRIPDMDVDTKVGKIHLRARPRINGYFAVGDAKSRGIGYGPKG